MSWRAVVRGCFLSLLLAPLYGCSLFDRREVVYLEGPPPPGAKVITRTPRQAKPAGAAEHPGAAAEGDEPSAQRGDLQPMKGETKAAPPAASKADRAPDEPDVPKAPPAKEKEAPPAPPAKAAPKAANGVVPANHATEGGPALPPLEDPRVRPAPTAMGSVMQLPPGESPVERALELTKRVDQLSLEKKALHQRICALEEAMAASGKQMSAVTRQVEEAGSEVARARKDLQTWSDDLREQHARLRQQEKENQELLKMVIATLEKMLGADAASALPKVAPGGGL